MDFQTKFNEGFKKMLMEEPIKFEIPKQWYRYGLIGLGYATPMSVGMAGTELWEILVMLENHKKPNCFQFAFVNNLIEGLTAKQLELEVPDYINFMILTEDLGKLWTEQTANMKEALMQALAKELPKQKELADKKIKMGLA